MPVANKASDSGKARWSSRQRFGSHSPPRGDWAPEFSPAALPVHPNSDFTDEGKKGPDLLDLGPRFTTNQMEITHSISSEIADRPKTTWHPPSRDTPAWDTPSPPPPPHPGHPQTPFQSQDYLLCLQWFQKLHPLEPAGTFPNHDQITIFLTHAATKRPMWWGICYSPQTRSNINEMFWPPVVQRKTSVFKSKIKTINLTAVSKS